jgi:tetratricopeptide (TPR) repeat protein
MLSKNITLPVVILVLASCLGLYMYQDIKSKNNVSSQNSSTTTPTVNNGIQATGGYTVEQIPLNSSLAAKQPNLDRPILFGPDTTPEVKKIITTNVSNFVAKLKKDSSSLSDWMGLGAQLKIAGDYKWAEEVWKYTGLLSPAYYVSFNNLGDLYAHYVTNYPKAEENFKKVILLKPDYIDSYRALYELYRYSYTEKASLAPQVLKDGLAANPKSTDLMILLAQYYKETGDTTNARMYYQKAITEAKTQGNTSLATLIEQELNNL